MNYKQMQLDVTKLLKSLGQTVGISREDTVIGKAQGVFAKSASEDKGSPSTDVINGLSMFVSAGKIVPQVGDYIVIKDTNYYVNVVEAYKPGTVTIAYKLTVTA